MWLIYLGLAGRLSLPEVTAGAAAAALALALLTTVQSVSVMDFACRRPSPRTFFRLSGNVAGDCVLVAGAILRSLAGRTRLDGALQLDTFGPEATRERTPLVRAAKVLGRSLTPNSYVVRTSDQSMVVHRLVAAGEPTGATTPEESHR